MTDRKPSTASAPEGILEAAIYAEDLSAAEAFYGDVLGLPLVQKVEGRHVFFRVGDTILLVFNPNATERPTTNPDLPVPPHGARGPCHVCFAMPRDQIEAIKTHLATQGVRTEADFAWPNGARSVYIRDPAGNSIEFAEPRLWS